MSINRKQAIHIFIKGRMQGVSFCYFTLKQAQNLNTEDWYGIIQRGMGRLLPRGIYLQQGLSFYRVDEMKLIWEHAERDYSDFPLSDKCN